MLLYEYPVFYISSYGHIVEYANKLISFLRTANVESNQQNRKGLRDFIAISTIIVSARYLIFIYVFMTVYIFHSGVDDIFRHGLAQSYNSPISTGRKSRNLKKNERNNVTRHNI
jgi:hypothetical protein